MSKDYIDFADDNDIEENDEDGGMHQCDHCCETFYITEGYSDEYCSEECYKASLNDT